MGVAGPFGCRLTFSQQSEEKRWKSPDVSPYMCAVTLFITSATCYITFNNDSYTAKQQ
jgi:hypothetical protein